MRIPGIQMHIFSWSINPKVFIVQNATSTSLSKLCVTTTTTATTTQLYHRGEKNLVPSDSQPYIESTAKKAVCCQTSMDVAITSALHNSDNRELVFLTSTDLERLA